MAKRHSTSEWTKGLRLVFMLAIRLAVLVPAVAGYAAVPGGSFNTGQRITAPLFGTPRWEVTADFNGDGKADLAILYTNTLSVLLGNGDGTFQSSIDRSLGLSANTVSMAVGDFNRDGKADLVIVYTAPLGPGPIHTVGILLGNGDGTFQSETDVPGGTGISSVAVGDFDGDGKADLVVTHFLRANTVSVLPGNGDGTFQSSRDYTTGNSPVSVAVGDFNGDGKSDLAVLNCGCFGYPPNGSVSVLLSTGTNFAPQVDYPVPTSLAWITVGDFNGDGRTDLVASGNGGAGLLLGNADGTFVPGPNPGISFFSPFVAPIDFNGDGKTDMVVISATAPALPLILVTGKGDGTFDAPNFTDPLHPLDPNSFFLLDYPADATAGMLVVADFNGDGRADLAVLLQVGARILLGTPLNTPAGSNVTVQPVDHNTAGSPVSLTFSSVSTTGMTSLTTSLSGPPPPSGFSLGNPPVAYDLSTTAVFTGSITLCINYTGMTFFTTPSLLHFESGAWQDVTTSVDTVNHIVCGSVTSLSPFGLFGKDTTAPAIVPTVSGTLGNNGWYRSSVIVSWSVTDPESGIVSPGCEATALKADTPGVTLTCSATNGVGLSNSASVTIKIDQTPPAIVPLVTGQPGATGWYVGDVTAAWSVTDAVSGIAESSGCGTVVLNAYTAGTTVSCSATNGAGSANGTSVTIRINEARIQTLSPTAANAFLVSGNSAVKTSGEIAVNSTSAKAMVVSGASKVSARAVQIAGGFSAPSGAINPAPVTGALSRLDPLATLQPPSYSGCDFTNFKLTGVGNATLTPGVYCGGITIAGNATATFAAGSYILNGGGLNASGNASLSGQGVTFYNTGSGSSYKPVTISGSVKVNLSAPASGPMSGILFFQDRNAGSGSANTLSGDVQAQLGGTLYFPTTGLVVSGNSGSSGGGTTIIANTVEFSGNAYLR